MVTAFLLDGVGFGKDAFLLGELIDRPTALADLMRRSAVVKEFITYRDGEFVSRSPILARFVLTSFETSGSVEVALRELFRRAASRRTVNCEIENLTAQLMQYSQVESLFPKRQKVQMLANYYEGIKNMVSPDRLHHYWLQYAIARIAGGDFEKAEVFLDNAYAMAKANGRDPYYIDNHRARFLLSRALHKGQEAGSAEAFRLAHTILIWQMKRKETRYYPYRVAQLYGEVGDVFFDSWKSNEQLYFTGACKAVLKAIAAAPESLRRHRVVQDCAEAVSGFLDTL